MTEVTLTHRRTFNDLEDTFVNAKFETIFCILQISLALFVSLFVNAGWIYWQLFS